MVRALLEAAPAAAMVADMESGRVPLHLAVVQAESEPAALTVAHLLLLAAPEAALRAEGLYTTPLHKAALFFMEN